MRDGRPLSGIILAIAHFRTANGIDIVYSFKWKLKLNFT